MRRKHRQSHLGHRRRSVVAVVMVVALILVAAAAGGGYLLLRTKGSPQQTEASVDSGYRIEGGRRIPYAAYVEPHAA